MKNMKCTVLLIELGSVDLESTNGMSLHVSGQASMHWLRNASMGHVCRVRRRGLELKVTVHLTFRLDDGHPSAQWHSHDGNFREML